MDARTLEAAWFGKTAHGPVALKQPQVMLYAIDKGKNSSKFYEMAVVPAGRASAANKYKGVSRGDGDWCLMKRWGRLTDSGATGRVDSMNEYYEDLSVAQNAMRKTKAAKERGSSKYQDVSRSKEYPIGLGGAGFGWGGQAACSVQPELRTLHTQMSKAQEDLNKGLKMIGPIAKTDSSMAKKLQGQIQLALKNIGDISTYLNQQLSSC